SSTYIAAQNGAYSVAVTLYDCTDTSASYPFIALGVNNIPGFSAQLYPNPGNGYFILEFSDNTEKQIEINDALGRCVLPEEKVERKKEIRLNASAGLYFLSIKQNSMRQVIKFVNAM